SVTLNIEKTAPVITITSPAPGSLTRQSTVTVTGNVTALSGGSVSVNGVPASTTGASPIHFSAVVPLLEGQNVLAVSATNAAGRRGEASVGVVRDTQPPSIDVVTPDRVSVSRPGQVFADVLDANGVAEVVFLVNGVAELARTAPPFVLDLQAPPGARNGDTLELTVQARDGAGNQATVSRAVRVAATGVFVGQVLSDITGLPLAGATVALEAGASTVTDESGRYTLAAAGLSDVIRVEKDGMTSVQRPVAPQSDVGTIPVDARLTPRAPPLVVDASGRPIDVTQSGPQPWSAAIAIPAGAFPGGAQVRATPLSSQGLPLLLPLGWSPIAAFELDFDVAPGADLAASLGGTDGATLLGRHDAPAHAWRVVEPVPAPVDGRTAVSLNQPGIYALVARDPWLAATAALQPGEILGGVDAVAIPATASGSAQGAPSALPASGGVVRSDVSVQSPDPLPSGTVIQAALTESFSLTSGDAAVAETRYQ